MTRNLEPIAPQKAVDSTSHNGRTTLLRGLYRLTNTVTNTSCAGVERGTTNLNNLTGRRLYEYRLWRKDDGDLKPVSLRTQLSTLRAFVRFCESIDAVESGTHEEILLRR